MTHYTSDCFIDRLLQIPFIDPQSDLISLCDSWLVATQGEWVWLWIQNMFTGEWELRKHRSRSSKEYLPKHEFSTGERSIAQYSAENNEIMELTEHEFSLWEKKKEIGGLTRQYRCLSAKSLLEFNCKRFLCIPIKSSPASPTYQQLYAFTILMTLSPFFLVTTYNAWGVCLIFSSVTHIVREMKKPFFNLIRLTQLLRIPKAVTPG
jgi:hypothetical protein